MAQTCPLKLQQVKYTYTIAFFLHQHVTAGHAVALLQWLVSSSHSTMINLKVGHQIIWIKPGDKIDQCRVARSFTKSQWNVSEQDNYS
jgi:hypothetical protein